MFDFIRNHKKWMQFILLLLILPSFVFFGIEGYSQLTTASEDVAKWSTGSVSKQEFENYFQQLLLQESEGKDIDPQQFNTPEIREQVLRRLIDSKLLDNIVADNFLSVSDARLQQAILSSPFFQVDGKFDLEYYKQILSENQLTVAEYEQSVRSELLQSDVLAAGAKSVTLSPGTLKSIEQFMGRRYDMRFQVYTVDTFARSLKVTPEALAAFYAEKDTMSFFTRPDAMKIRYFSVDIEGVYKNLPAIAEDVIAAEVQKAIQQKAGSQSRQVRVIQIPKAGQNPESTKKLQDELLAEVQELRKNPENFSKALEKHSPPNTPNLEESATIWIDKNDASMSASIIGWLFSPNAKVGSISDPILDGDSFYILKVLDERTIDEGVIRTTVLEGLKNKQAGEAFRKMFEQAQVLETNGSAGFATALKTFGVQAQEIESLTASNNANLPTVFADAAVLNKLFTSENKAVPRFQVIQHGNDGFVGVEVLKFTPSHLPELKEVATEVEYAYRLKMGRNAMLEKANESLKVLQAGKSIDGLQPLVLDRSALLNQNLPVPQRVTIESLLNALAQVRQSKLPESLIVPIGNDGNILWLVQVNAIQNANPPTDEIIQAVLAQQQSSLDMIAIEALKRALQKSYGVEITDLGKSLIDSGF